MAEAVEQEELLTQQAQSLHLEELEKAGESYLEETELTGDLDVKGTLQNILNTVRTAVGGALKDALRSCMILLAITLLCGLAEGLKVGVTQKGIDVVTLAATLAITAVAVGDVDSLLGMGEDAIANMEMLGDLLLPTVSMATAASGAPTAAAVKQAATILFSDFLIRLIDHVLLPLAYAFLAANVAWAALGNDGLKRLSAFLKWIVITILSAVLLAFVGYLNLSGVIAGGADASAVKAAKFTISNLVPVVGGVISDTAETLLVGTSILRNAAGVFGMLAVVGICVIPFLNLGAHYLMYKGTAAVAATASTNSQLTGLVEAVGSTFGLIMAMTGACGMLLIVAMVSAVSAVAG